MKNVFLGFLSQAYAITSRFLKNPKFWLASEKRSIKQTQSGRLCLVLIVLLLQLVLNLVVLSLNLLTVVAAYILVIAHTISELFVRTIKTLSQPFSRIREFIGKQTLWHLPVRPYFTSLSSLPKDR